MPQMSDPRKPPTKQLLTQDEILIGILSIASGVAAFFAESTALAFMSLLLAALAFGMRWRDERGD